MTLISMNQKIQCVNTSMYTNLKILLSIGIALFTFYKKDQYYYNHRKIQSIRCKRKI